MHLEREEEKGEAGGGQTEHEVSVRREEEEVEVCRHGESEGGGQTELCKLRYRHFLSQFVYNVQSTPEVCHFVLKQSSAEGKYSSDDFHHRLGPKVKERTPNKNKGSYDAQSDLDQFEQLLAESFLTKTFPKEEEEERQSMVEFHLLIAEGCTEQDGSNHVFILHNKCRCCQEQSQADVVVLEVSVVDEDEPWVCKQGDGGETVGSEHEYGGDENDEIGCQD